MLRIENYRLIKIKYELIKKWKSKTWTIFKISLKTPIVELGSKIPGDPS